MITVLSLVVAFVAVWLGPLIGWANVQRQIRASARETWMREFRQHVADLLRNQSFRSPSPEMHSASRLSSYMVTLLIAERAPLYDGFLSQLDGIMGSGSDEEFASAAADILRRERAAIMADPGVWREMAISLGFHRDWP